MWLFIEIFGAVTGLIYLYLEIKQKMSMWAVGIVTSALYIYIFFTAKFYADAGLQVYYLAISFYGWYHWKKGGEKHETKVLPVTHITKPLAIRLVAITAVLFVGMALVLDKLTDSPVPIGDAFTTALGITATWMLARKIIEHWHIWVIVNTVSLGLYIYKELYPTAVLYLFYATMAVVGYYQWRKEMRKANNPTEPAHQ